MYGQLMIKENGNQHLYYYELVEQLLVLNGLLMVIIEIIYILNFAFQLN